MKLTIEPQPKEYTDDKAAMLQIVETGEFIVIGTPGAQRCAREIRRAVNFHEPLVAVLTLFRSSEMGKLLIDAMFYKTAVADVAPIDDIIEAQSRMTKLINSVDVILKGLELMKERDEAPDSAMQHDYVPDEDQTMGDSAPPNPETKD